MRPKATSSSLVLWKSAANTARPQVSFPFWGECSPEYLAMVVAKSAQGKVRWIGLWLQRPYMYVCAFGSYFIKLPS